MIVFYCCATSTIKVMSGRHRALLALLLGRVADHVDDQRTGRRSTDQEGHWLPSAQQHLGHLLAVDKARVCCELEHWPLHSTLSRYGLVPGRQVGLVWWRSDDQRKPCTSLRFVWIIISLIPAGLYHPCCPPRYRALGCDPIPGAGFSSFGV